MIVIAISFIGVGIFIYTRDTTLTSKVPNTNKEAGEKLIETLSEQLKVEGYTLQLVKHEGDVYYFTQVDKDGNVGYEVTYNEKTKEIATIDKNEISEGYEEVK